MPELLECEEFGELSVRVSSLLSNGELKLDDRIANRGYLAASIKGGEIVLRATKYVGIIPVTSSLSVRVKPRSSIANLSHMLARSGVIPAAVPGFSRGYFPRFVSAEKAEKIYGRSLVDGIKTIAIRGLMKQYLQPKNPVPWRGRLLPSETVRRHAARGVTYRHEFEQNLLSSGGVENVALKVALLMVRDWFVLSDKKSLLPKEISPLLHLFDGVPDWPGPKSELLRLLRLKIRTLSPLWPHYRDPLWLALLIILGALPDFDEEGFLRLDSLIVDVSVVFENYVRNELRPRIMSLGFHVDDGNHLPGALFVEGGPYSVHPDIIISKDGKPVAVLDAKYKTDPKEQDRYEVLSFMDALGVQIGGFVCPTYGGDVSRFLGTTETGKRLFSLRYDLAAVDLAKEADRFCNNVVSMLRDSRAFH